MLIYILTQRFNNNRIEAIFYDKGDLLDYLVDKNPYQFEINIIEKNKHPVIVPAIQFQYYINHAFPVGESYE